MTIRGLRNLFCCVLAALALYAQGTTSRLVGTITDSSGASVAGAVVRLTNEGTGTTFEVKASGSGSYVFEALQSGRYTVRVNLQGFKEFVSTGNQVTIGQPTTVNVTLEVGALSERVEVVGTSEAVQTSTSGNIGNLLTEQVIRDLPIVGTRGRNPLDLTLLQPGVVAGSNTGGGTHVNGARDRAWNFTLDGIDNNETSAGGSRFSPLRANPDSVAEFRVITANPTSEYGRNSGGSVAMITRSGTNEFHGTGFWFYRTPRLNANEWENNLNNRFKGQFVQTITGGSFGGPIIKNKTFFFGNVQYLKALTTALINRTVFTQTARQGTLRYVRGGRNLPAGVAGASVDAQGNVLAGVNVGTYNVVQNDPLRLGIDPTIQGAINAAPLPNNFTLGDGLNTAGYTFVTPSSIERQRDNVFKVDHIFNSKNTFFARVAWGYQNTLCDSANAGQELFPGRGCVVNTARSPRNYAFNWRYNPRPSMTNELVVGINRFRFEFDSPFFDVNRYTLTTGLVNLQETSAYGNTRTLTTWQVVDNFSWVKGAHSVKFGLNLRFTDHFDQRGSVGGNIAPSLDFSTGVQPVDPATFNLPADIEIANDRARFQTAVNLLLGRVGTQSQGFWARGDKYVSGIFEYTSNSKENEFYIQDTWKVNRRLTVDVGLRLEMKSPPSSPDSLYAPDRALVAGAAPADSATWVSRDLFPSRNTNLGPSIGFAWDPTGSGKSSIRANYRTAFDRLPTFLPSSFIYPNLPGKVQAVTTTAFGNTGGRLRNVQPIAAPTASPASLLQPPAVSLNGNTVFDPNFKFPQTHMWSLSLQREILKRTVLDITYIGRRAYHLVGGYNANQPEIFRNGFLDAFKVAKAGGESPLLDRLTAADTRRNATETGAAFLRRNFTSLLALNSVEAVAASLASRVQNGQQAVVLAGNSPYFFSAFPQYLGALNVIDSNDFSTYHALQVQVERRFNNGIGWQASYSLSKSLDTRSFDPAFTLAATGSGQSASSTPFDINNRKLNYAPSDFDRTHILQSNWVMELPFGKGKRFGGNVSQMMNRVIGGWELSGILRIQAGRPYTIYSGANTFSGLTQSPANCSGCTRDLGEVIEEQGVKFYLSSTQRGSFSTPNAGELGNTGRNFFRGPGAFNMDVALLKRIALTERMRIELRADATNFTNTPTFNIPTATITSGTFGRIRDDVISGSRKIQLGAKFHF
ncbi:MAG: carboxypeptidase regulatory-like domain-containing protein [Acidobacteria bacterium]|nr:carboxypeptidase regulatory-like domain-containing protein [Acidobacteriota bacterium]